MDSEDGELFIKQLANFVRTHEKALANALQFRRQNVPRHGSSQSVSSIPTSALSASSPTLSDRPSTSSSTTSSLAAALSLGPLSLASHNIKSATLALTAHHLFYLLSRFEELSIPVGPMGVRIENIHDANISPNYVSFLSQSQRSKTHGSDVGSIRSVSSIRSVMSGMSALWASFGIGSSISAARTERQKAAIQSDLKYLYSAFTKIPCLRLAPDWRAHLIKGYEEFPFDSAVPLYVFKNVQALEVCDMDFRQFFGWDRLAEQLRSLTLKRAHISDPAEILIDIVLDDMDKRRRRTTKAHASPTGFSGSAGSHTGGSPRRSTISLHHSELRKTASMPASPETRGSGLDLRIGSVISEPIPDGDERSSQNGGDQRPSLARSNSDEATPNGQEKTATRPRSHSPRRPSSSRNGTSHVRVSHKVSRSGSGSSHSSLSDSWHNRRGSSSNLLNIGIVPAFKWRFLKHLSLADNALTSIPASSLAPLSNTLHSLDLSSNLFVQIPDSLATLSALRALNLSRCMIDSLHSLTRCPLPAITALNLRDNRLQSIAGIEKLFPLERLDLRENRLTDPMELARLTGIPDIREVWVGGNPFTRTHRDYRITIFNLFRKTPGYTEDIIIDSTGPSYSERKYLVERCPLPPVVPVIKPPPIPTMPAVDVKPAIIYDPPREPAVLRKERPSSTQAVASEATSNSTRRRKVPRRRIVDLATSDTTSRSATLAYTPSYPHAPVAAPLEPRALPPDPAPAPTPSSVLSPGLGSGPGPALVHSAVAGSDVARSIRVVSTPLIGLSPVVEVNDHRSINLPETPPAVPPKDTPPRRVDPPEIPQVMSTTAGAPFQPAYTPTETEVPGIPSLPKLPSIANVHAERMSLVKDIHTPPQSPTKPTAAPETPVMTPTPTPKSNSTTGTLWKESSSPDWDAGGELYKRKIEALRDQVGDGYLSVLTKETWDLVRHPHPSQYHDNPFSKTPTPIHSSPVSAHAPNLHVIHSGRTLG